MIHTADLEKGKIFHLFSNGGGLDQHGEIDTLGVIISVHKKFIKFMAFENDQVFDIYKKYDHHVLCISLHLKYPDPENVKKHAKKYEEDLKQLRQNRTQYLKEVEEKYDEKINLLSERFQQCNKALSPSS